MMIVGKGTRARLICRRAVFTISAAASAETPWALALVPAPNVVKLDPHLTGVLGRQ